MKVERLIIRATFHEPILGSLPGNKELLEEYIASKAPDPEKKREEVENVDEEVEKLTTVFARDERGLFVWDYHWRGFFKDNANAFAELGEAGALTVWGVKRAVDKFLFVMPRRIYIRRNGEIIKEHDGYNERSLRASTPRGDRICLARSQQINPGATMELEISWLVPGDAKKSKIAVWSKDLISKILDHGALSGWGQWRSGSYGRFTWEEIKAPTP